MRESEAGSWAGVRCVVTGGLGFIGSNLALTLAGAGAHVRVLDALVPSHGGNRHNLAGAVAPIDVTIADLADTAAVGPLVRDTDVIFNLAGQISHLDSMDDPLVDLDHNTRSHLAFLEVLRHQNSRAVVVHTSTRQVYGRARRLPVDEDHLRELGAALLADENGSGAGHLDVISSAALGSQPDGLTNARRGPYQGVA